MISDNEELFEIVDSSGNVKGLARRSELHSNPSLIHRVVHILVFNKEGHLLLQKRSMKKDISPGKWDTSVGGHINPMEDIYSAAIRELKEELGIDECKLEYLYEYLFTNHLETELVSTFRCNSNGPFIFNTEEIDEIKFWPLKEIDQNLDNPIFSDYFRAEFKNYLGFSRY